MTTHASLTGANLHGARSNSGIGTPVGTVVPAIVGEHYFDATPGSEAEYIATGLTNADWFLVSGGFVDPMTTRGDILIRDAANASSRLGVGIANQALLSDGTDIAWSLPVAIPGTGTNALVSTTGTTGVASAQDGIALGSASTSSAQDGIAIGRGATVTHADSVALGRLATTTAASQIMLGTATETISCPGRLILDDSAATPPLNITERAAEPTTPVAGDLYLDDGTNTASGNSGWRRCVSTGPNVWEDISGGAGGGSYLTATAIQTAGYAANSGDLVRCNTTAGTFIVTLPLAPSDGDRIGVMDVALGGSFETSNVLTLARNGNLIDSVADDLDLDVDKMAVEFVYDTASSNWVIYENPQGGGGSTGGAGAVSGVPTRVGALDIDGTVNTIDTNTTLYAVPASSYPSELIIKICNRNNAVVAVRVAHVDGAIGALSDADYLVYDVLLQPYETKLIEIDGAVSTDTFVVRSDTTDVSFVATAKLPIADAYLQRIAATTVIADTNTTLYVTAGDSFEDCSLFVCNRDSSNACTIRIALINGAIGTLTSEDYIVYEDTLLASETKVFSDFVHIPDGSTFMVRASDGDVNFVLYGRLYV